MPPRHATSAIAALNRLIEAAGYEAIVRTLLGDEAHWRLIYEANREAIGPNPDAITAGMKLTIPPRPRAGGGS